MSKQEPLAYASSVEWRKNHLMSKAQYDSCLPKNRVDFDVPLYASKSEEQELVAMKFKVYKPTVPNPMRQEINNALLPWVYDQDRSSGFDAYMWVTPVATLPPQRKPLTEEDLRKLADEHLFYQPESYEVSGVFAFARAIEAAHGIKEKNQ